MTLSRASDAEMQHSVSVLLGLGLILVSSFLLMSLFISFGMGMFTLCRCILELCILFVCLFILCRSSQLRDCLEIR